VVKLRKERAGSTSLGHHWAKDGAVVEVPQEHANILLGIPDAGFSEVQGKHEAPEAPTKDIAEDEPPKRGVRRRRDSGEDDALTIVE
jgi:hypothetical protein